MKINLTKQESEKHFHDALCNAVGSGYMNSYGLEFDVENENDYQTAKKSLKAKTPKETICYEDILMEVLRMGKKMKVTDLEEGEYNRTITLKDVHDKVAKTPIYHLTNAINETGDAITADVIIQTVFFEDIIFG